MAINDISPYIARRGIYQDWKRWDSSEFGEMRQEDSVYYTEELSACGITSINHMRVVEIGFGNGSFAAWAIKSKAEYIGIEEIPELIKLARDNGINAYSSKDNLSDIIDSGTVDLVIALDVFEHLPLTDLATLMAEIRSVLSDDGMLIARMPSGDSPFSRAIQHGDLTHQSVLGSSAVRQLAQYTGFKALQIRSPVLPLYGLGLKAFVRRYLVTMCRNLVFPIIIKVFMGGGRPVLTPNMVLVLQKIKRDT